MTATSNGRSREYRLAVITYVLFSLTALFVAAVSFNFGQDLRVPPATRILIWSTTFGLMCGVTAFEFWRSGLKRESLLLAGLAAVTLLALHYGSDPLLRSLGLLVEVRRT
ncbi:hypothetical protein Q0812_03805 [Brevundimonas sp. 2R-24]|uniref:Uncharacterized protein n=1 Tax=Peiella sedimenti TaxID=3061083 RepID=A0ABT8SIZ1_9CAUL|nr:hypothetical protein [Caulobacteraceae bacterium XZ-24]